MGGGLSSFGGIWVTWEGGSLRVQNRLRSRSGWVWLGRRRVRSSRRLVVFLSARSLVLRMAVRRVLVEGNRLGRHVERYMLAGNILDVGRESIDSIGKSRVDCANFDDGSVYQGSAEMCCAMRVIGQARMPNQRMIRNGSFGRSVVVGSSSEGSFNWVHRR